MWDELGIAPCDDPKAIRRAYAARLKTLDPDREPEAFARLRRAFEWALNGARGAAALVAASARREAEPETDRAEPTADHSSAPHVENAQAAQPQPSAQRADRDDIRDRALLGALDAALRRRDANEATALYYRAAATGALSLASAPDMLDRLFDLAVDDVTLPAAAFRNLVRAAGLDVSRSRAPITSLLRQRVQARLRVEDWYDELLATAQQRKGRVARRRGKVARLILGRIGRHWHPIRIDKTELKSLVAQYRTQEAWLKNRIDPAWISELEARLRRRDIFWLSCYSLLIGTLLIQFLHESVVAILGGTEPLWPLLAAPLLVAFLLWIFVVLVQQLLELTIPGRAGRIRAIWNRLRAKGEGDAG
jgi:hypothetical protein